MSSTPPAPAMSHADCLRLANPSELPPKALSALGIRNASIPRAERRAARHPPPRGPANASALAGRVFYAVLTTFRNHATRCTAIAQTWGAQLPWEHLVFYSDKPEPTLRLHVVALADARLAAHQLYDDAQDRFTYRILPDAARRMDALRLSWLLFADDDTFVWPENLHALLSAYDPSRWVWLGQTCPLLRGRRAFCGGAGFAMSAALTRVAACVAPLCSPYKGQGEIPYDRRMGVCFEDLLHVKVADMPEFNSQPPHFYQTAAGRGDRPYGYGGAVTFHYLKSDPRPVTPEQYYRALWSVTRAAYPQPPPSGDGKKEGLDRLAGIAKGRGWHSRGGGAPRGRVAADDAASDRARPAFRALRSFLKPRKGACDSEQAQWREIDVNVPQPLVPADAGEAGRCGIRFESFRDARAACCKESQCEAVVRDNGIQCAEGRRDYELRKGLTRDHLKGTGKAVNNRLSSRGREVSDSFRTWRRLMEEQDSE